MTDPDENDGAEIIDFSVFLKGEVDPKMRIKPRESGCISCTFLFDEKARTVECPKCGRKWEPFDALAHLARTWRNFAINRDHLRHEVSRLKEIEDRLRKNITNLKAAKRRADSPITELVAALEEHRERGAQRKKPKGAKGEFVSGYLFGLRQIIEFIRSDAWRKDGSS